MTLFLNVYIYKGSKKFYQYLGALSNERVRLLDIEKNKQVEVPTAIFKRDYYLHETLKISIF